MTSEKFFITAGWLGNCASMPNRCKEIF